MNLDFDKLTHGLSVRCNSSTCVVCALVNGKLKKLVEELETVKLTEKSSVPGSWLHSVNDFKDCPACGESAQEVFACKCPDKWLAELHKLKVRETALETALTDALAALGGCSRPMSKEPCGRCVVCRGNAALKG